jgi:hypothetical protein
LRKYTRNFEYTVVPEESFEIVRKCSGCGCKSVFYNTNNFRVNANGNKIDVWLIYQCRKCKHTNNLTVYERCRPEGIPLEEYEEYLSNSKKLAFRYGTDIQFFARNRVEVDLSNIKYRISKKNEKVVETKDTHKGDIIIIDNNHALKVRTDKIVSEILNISRSELKALEKSKAIVVTEEKLKHKIIIQILI